MMHIDQSATATIQWLQGFTCPTFAKKSFKKEGPEKNVFGGGVTN